MSKLIDETKLTKLFEDHKKVGETIFPELIKKLILSSKVHGMVRVPVGDAVWVPGYDCTLDNFVSISDYVPDGKSVWEFGTNDDYRDKINSDYNIIYLMKKMIKKFKYSWLSSLEIGLFIGR